MPVDETKKIAELEKKLVVANKKISALKKISIENLPCEIWRDVVGYEGFYQVSNKGRVKSFYKNRNLILKTVSDDEGYQYVSLYKNGHGKKIHVHVLVAQNFIPNPKNLPFVGHEDNNTSNNCVENLKWITQKENIIHSYDCGKISTNRPAFKDSPEIVRYIRENFLEGDEEFGIRALAKKFNVNRLVVRNIVRNKTYKNIK